MFVCCSLLLWKADECWQMGASCVIVRPAKEEILRKQFHNTKGQSYENRQKSQTNVRPAKRKYCENSFTIPRVKTKTKVKQMQPLWDRKRGNIAKTGQQLHNTKGQWYKKSHQCNQCIAMWGRDKEEILRWDTVSQYQGSTVGLPCIQVRQFDLHLRFWRWYSVVAVGWKHYQG